VHGPELVRNGKAEQMYVHDAAFASEIRELVCVPFINAFIKPR